MQQKQLSKTLLFVITFFLVSIFAFSQTAKPVTIIVTGTTYDNSNLTSLKNYLKTKTGITGFKTAFNNATATLSFTSTKDADDLWDEIPDDKKAGFSVAGIDTKTIKLEGAKSAATASTTKFDKNCGCDYFPLCKNDGTQSFQGEVWKMINYDGKKIYYYCENGVLKEKSALYNWDGDFVGYLTFTALKYNEPENASWKETVELTGGIKRWYSHTIIKKDGKIEVDGKIHENVIFVKREVSEASIFYQGQPTNLQNWLPQKYYYVKNVGVFGEKYVKEVNIENRTTSTSLATEDNAKSKFINEIVKEAWYVEIKNPSQKGGVVTFNQNGIATFKYNSDSSLSNWRIKGDNIELKDKATNEVWTKGFEIISSNGNITELKLIPLSTKISLKRKSDIKMNASANSLTSQKLIATWSGQYILGKQNGKVLKSKDRNEYIQFNVLSGVKFQKVTYDPTYAIEECKGIVSFTGSESNYTMFIKDCSGNLLKVDEKSIPRRRLIIGNREYSFLE